MRSKSTTCSSWAGGREAGAGLSHGCRRPGSEEHFPFGMSKSEGFFSGVPLQRWQSLLWGHFESPRAGWVCGTEQKGLPVGMLQEGIVQAGMLQLLTHSSAQQKWLSSHCVLQVTPWA